MVLTAKNREVRYLTDLFFAVSHSIRLMEKSGVKFILTSLLTAVKFLLTSMLWGVRFILTPLLLAVESVAIVLYSTVSLYCTVLSTVYCTVMYCAVIVQWNILPASPLYCVVQCSTTQYSGLIGSQGVNHSQHSTLLYSTLYSAQYSTRLIPRLICPSLVM